MQKPIVVARQDFLSELVQLINNSQLPMFAVNDILSDIQREVQAKAQEQYQMAKEAYEKELANESSEEVQEV